MESTTYIQCTISSITHVHPSSELKIYEIGWVILYSIQSFFKALYLTVFLQSVPCNGSTNVEDTLIYFVSKFIVEYAFLL